MKSPSRFLRPWQRNTVVAILVLLLGVPALLALTNALLTALERSEHPAPGRLVTVGDQRLHVLTVGEGPAHVVLLAGLGTRSPVIDFAPLTRELQGQARVTVVEYPGYGWSDDTDASRSTSASVDELRAALSGAGLRPPYLLVVHSISGLQALDFASRFPEEVAGLVGLESSLPGQLPFMTPPPEGPDLNELLGFWGVVRWALTLDPSLSGAQTSELTPQEVQAFARITNWTLGSRAIRNEGKMVIANLQTAQVQSLPKELPVTFVLASQALENTEGIPGPVWRSEHERLVAGHPFGKVVVLRGNHYIHHGNAKAVASLVLEMLASIPRLAWHNN